MEAQGYQQYKQQSVSTMTPGELLIVLYDELVKRAARADIALGQADYPLFEASVDRCLDILHYLDNTLDNQYPISRELHRLYDFFCYDFSRVKAGRNQAELKQLLTMVGDLRDTFRAAEKDAPER
ncbi:MULTISPECIES: flagellar export chaperone FliS [unclassified Oscillibacter]|uniref:flagellar export chaperone FliS n=1 Tax=unclassified Oscillibacter TaxID=2629304 RepID=UPI0025CE1AAB|nr:MULTISPECIES: flagellar export chaperone FliS [unclassified Oscillibacter]